MMKLLLRWFNINEVESNWGAFGRLMLLTVILTTIITTPFKMMGWL